MAMVKIGPKKYTSSSPVGLVEYETTFQKISLANQGRLGQQVFKFNLLLLDHNYAHRHYATYIAIMVVNGHCAYKRYTLLDTVIHKICQLVGRIV